MKKAVFKAALAGLSTIVVHFCFEIVGTTIAEGEAIYGLLRPLSWQTVPNYLVTFLVQAVTFGLAYAIVGQRLPGNSVLTKGILFGLMIYLLSGVAALAPMVLVFEQPLSLMDVILVGIVGTLAVSVSMGIAFVTIWERV